MDRLRTLLQPHLVFLPFVALGFLCWLLPRDLIGIDDKSDLGFVSITVVVVWYGLIVLACLTARRTARSITWINHSRTVYSSTFYYLLTTIALVGTVATLGTLGSLGEVLAAVRDLQVNRLKEALYSEYSAGLLTLRYAAALSGAYALFRILILRRASPLDCLNLALVLLCAFISARIMLIQTAFFFGFVFMNQFGPQRRSIRLGKIRGASLILVILGAIVTFTYLRSASTYRQELGITNPVAVTAVELARYAGMPVQVTIGVGEIIADTDVVERTRIRPVYIAPTFFHPDDIEGDNSGGVGSQWYLALIDLPPTLTTNSALAALVGYLGFWSFLVMPIVCFFYALVFFMLRPLHNFEARLFQAVILYAFFEIWRLYFFSAGTFIFMNVLMLGFFAVQIATGRLVLGQRTRQRRIEHHPGARANPAPPMETAHAHPR